MKYFISLAIIILLSSCAQKDNQEFLNVSGPYLGQTPPDSIPQMFCKDIISKEYYTRDFAMTPDGKEIYYSVVIGNFVKSVIMVTKEIDGRWTKPEVASFSKDFSYQHIEPFITPKGDRMFFVSNSSVNRTGVEKEDFDIWVMDRVEDDWSEPYNLELPVNSDGSEFYPTTTKDGTLYFTRQPKGERANFIFRSKFVDGKYMEPVKLGPNVNAGRSQFNAFIDPDERYLIVPVFGLEDTYGSTDYYITYRNTLDEWSEPINMGDRVNSPSGREYCPYVTRDSKYFFFMSFRGADIKPDRMDYNEILSIYSTPGRSNPAIYWVAADFIEELRPDRF